MRLIECDSVLYLGCKPGIVRSLCLLQGCFRSRNSLIIAAGGGVCGGQGVQCVRVSVISIPCRHFGPSNGLIGISMLEVGRQNPGKAVWCS